MCGNYAEFWDRDEPRVYTEYLDTKQDDCAIVVGGSAASNPTAQVSLAGGNNGSNLEIARNLFTPAGSRCAFSPCLLPLAFPGETDLYTLHNVTKAIASFERTIISVRSPYDRYRWGGDPSAISEAAKRGEIIFSSSERGGCFQCHGGWTFGGGIRFEGSEPSRSNDEERGGFFNTGVSTYEAPNRGVYETTHRPEDIGKFRAPTLRNIAVTAPYMHDGSLATLDEVIDHYAAGGRFDHPNKTHILHRFSLTATDRKDLVEFLNTFTD